MFDWNMHEQVKIETSCWPSPLQIKIFVKADTHSVALVLLQCFEANSFKA